MERHSEGVERVTSITSLQRWLLRRAQRMPSRVLAMHHAELVAGVSGQVVEIGAGSGTFCALSGEDKRVFCY